MREMRLALPPPIFKAMKEQEKEQEEVAPVQVEEEEEEAEEEPDPMFDRISATLLGLIERCREAVAAKDEKVRVLNVNQVRAWEGRRGEDDEERAAEGDGDGDGDGEADASFVTASGSDDDESVDSEDEDDEREVVGLLNVPTDRTSLGRRVTVS